MFSGDNIRLCCLKMEVITLIFQHLRVCYKSWSNLVETLYFDGTETFQKVFPLDTTSISNMYNFKINEFSSNFIIRVKLKVTFAYKKTTKINS